VSTEFAAFAIGIDSSRRTPQAGSGPVGLGLVANVDVAIGCLIWGLDKVTPVEIRTETSFPPPTAVRIEPLVNGDQSMCVVGQKLAQGTFSAE